MKKYPARKNMVLATLCYLQFQGKTLMMHRVKKEQDMHEGKWNGLGGKIEPGESPEENIIREFKEESGLVISELKLKGTITFPLFDGKNNWYLFIFTANKFTGKLIGDDLAREGNLRWIANNRLMDLNLWAGDKIFMKWLKQKKFFSAKFIYQKGVFKKYKVIFY